MVAIQPILPMMTQLGVGSIGSHSKDTTRIKERGSRIFCGFCVVVCVVLTRTIDRLLITLLRLQLGESTWKEIYSHRASDRSLQYRRMGTTSKGEATELSRVLVGIPTFWRRRKEAQLCTVATEWSMQGIFVMAVENFILEYNG